ncbi:ATP-binding protein [Neisseria sp. Ec49-e6-T10]|uniref:ATP-binding protein n=1 Tax=Neisseria sp. Ec49-e6-T10 TaxID=3140744 RepID=UPI003EBAD301
MKKLIPQSLFWRLIWVLVAGLLVTQIISLIINYEDKDQLLTATADQQLVQRITETVELLDSLNIDERQHIISIVNIPPQKVSLSQTPKAILQNNTDTTSAHSVKQLLSGTLGSNRTIYVAQTANTVPMMGHGMGMGHGRRRAMMEGKEFVPGMYRNEHIPNNTNAVIGATFIIQIQLLDGSWVIFDTYAPKTSVSLPSRLMVTLVVLLLAVFVLSFIAVRWLTRPLHELSNAAEALGNNINQPPLPEKGPTEIKQAAHAFNVMQQRLKHFIQDRTHIFAAMSHDLKTPITRLRLRAEMLEDDSLRQRFEQDLKEMEQMVSQTLDFMKGLDTQEKKQPINMMALLESLQTDYIDSGKNVYLTGHSTQPFVGFASLLKRCLVNLIDNAVFYGKQASIIIEDTQDKFIIRIQDNGSGIAQEEQDKVFEPFYRSEHSRNRQTGGTGLGLTIARNIIHTHGGEIILNNLKKGGLEVTLILPRTKI